MSNHSYQALISVIIPVYNTEKYLSKCVESVINQTLKEIEIIIINDGSKDNSLVLSKQYAEKDNRIKVFTQENQGLGFSRNTGMQKASSSYIFFLDSDDWLELNTLEKVYAKSQAENSDVVICGWKRIDEINFETLQTRTDLNLLGDTSKKHIMEQVFSGKMNLMTCACLMKKSIFDDHHIIFPDVYHEDLYVMPKVYTFANKISIVKDNLYNWLMRSDSISNRSNIQHAIGICGAIYDLKIFLYKENIYTIHQNHFLKLVLTHLNTLLTNAEKYASKDAKVKIYELLAETLLSTNNLKDFEIILDEKELLSRVKILNFYIEIIDQLKNTDINNSIKHTIVNNRETAINDLNQLLIKRDMLIANRNNSIKELKEKIDSQSIIIENHHKTIKKLKSLTKKMYSLLSNKTTQLTIFLKRKMK